MSDAWSLDARVLVRPARAFRALADTQNAAHTRSTFWIGARRPLFLTVVLVSVVSLVSSSVATLRLMAPTAIYWSFVAVAEILALAIVVWRRHRSRGLPSLIDVFFAGHTAWTVFLLAFGAVLPVASPQHWWFLLTRPVIIGVVLAAGWSAHVDFCFFRHMCGARFARAIGDVALHRLITWTLIFWIFAVPQPTPIGVIQVIDEAIVEVLK